MPRVGKEEERGCLGSRRGYRRDLRIGERKEGAGRKGVKSEERGKRAGGKGRRRGSASQGGLPEHHLPKGFSNKSDLGSAQGQAGAIIED